MPVINSKTHFSGYRIIASKAHLTLTFLPLIIVLPMLLTLCAGTDMRDYVSCCMSPF